MACYSVTRYGFPTVSSLMANVDATLTSVLDGVTYFTRASSTPNTPYTFAANSIWLYSTTANSDPLSGVMLPGRPIEAGWRFGFWIHDTNRLTVHAGTELQYPNDATRLTVAYNTNRAYGGGTVVYREPPGTMTVNTWSQTTTVGSDVLPYPNPTSFNEVWLNRQATSGLAANAYPMNYTLTMTSRGVFFTIWEDNQEEVPKEPTGISGYTDPNQVYGNSPIRWFLIQRPVDRVSGHVRGGAAMRLARGEPGVTSDPATEPSRCPVYAVFGSGHPNSYRKFVVRENDVQTPGAKKHATLATEDSPALINPNQQQSITETGEFVVTFLNNLSTPRYRYGDELDMLGTVGAEVIGPGTAINAAVYSETIGGNVAYRRYTALYSNDQYGTGMRLVALTQANATVESTHI